MDPQEIVSPVAQVHALIQRHRTLKASQAQADSPYSPPLPLTDDEERALVALVGEPS